MDEKQYNTVVLAALLHDVGKLLHRGNKEYKYSDGHEAASANFVLKFREILKNNDLYDVDLVKILVLHHKPKVKKEVTLSDRYFSNKPEEEKNKFWKLISIVRRADIYSCAERELDEKAKTGFADKNLPLTSIFSTINLNGSAPQERDKIRYNFTPSKPLESFPSAITDLNDKDISDHIKAFEDGIPDFSRLNKFEDVLNIWLNILEKYMWAVPSDTRYKNSDVSLYDHLRSSAAIVACLYKHHRYAIEEGKKFKGTNEFIFVGGDFSGIQEYIFDITNLGSGGAAKRLRARSFFIWLFSEVTVHKLLHTLELPLVCNFFSAGGKFLLLVPNVDGLEDKLRLVKAEIQQEIHNTYFGQFSFLMSHSPIKDFKKEFKIYQFFKTADAMFERLESEKNKKFQDILFDASTSRWNTQDFKASKIYDAYQNNGICKICGKNPGTLKEEDETGDSVECCFTCYRDKKYLGQKLPKCNYIAFGKGFVSATEENEGRKIVIFHSNTKDDQKDGREQGKNGDSYYVELLKNYKTIDKNDGHYLIYDIDINEQQTEEGCVAPIKKHYANYIPITNDEEVLSFKEIAEFSKWHKADGKEYGSELLGVLKVDVDNLGLIFSKGFENPGRAEQGLKDIDRKTVSRYLTMSRMLELFFSGWLKEILSGNHKEKVIAELITLENIDKDRFKKYLEFEQINFNKIYTVYSGGDDLVLVGPWETVIIFSIFLNWQFRKYTCNNPFITLSAGLTFIKPNFPVASAIKQAEMLLAKSKERAILEESGNTMQKQGKTPIDENDIGKEGITLFGRTVKWNRLPELINFFLFLNEKLNNDDENPDDNKSNINTSFLYRLLEYHRMALKFLDDKDVKGLKYLSALSYDVGRNIVKRNKDGSIIKGHENEQKVLQSLINKIPDKKSIIYNIKIPLFWALYRYRNAMKD